MSDFRENVCLEVNNEDFKNMASSRRVSSGFSIEKSLFLSDPLDMQYLRKQQLKLERKGLTYKVTRRTERKSSGLNEN